jgi:integrase
LQCQTKKGNDVQYHNKGATTLQDVLDLVEYGRLPQPRRRDMTSALTRICEMRAVVPAAVAAEAVVLRALVAKILPAAHGVKPKTWANILSQFRGALRHAGVIDPVMNSSALQNSEWTPLVKAAARDTRSSCGLACFFNWCASKAITPDTVDDAVVIQFLAWLETRTLCPRPRDVARRVLKLWNEMAATSRDWPRVTLSTISFKAPPKRVQWGDLAESFQHDAEAYLSMRCNPDLFDERLNAPKRPLAASTLHQQREHVRLAASVLIESGIPKEDIKSLSDLVEAERFKLVLRHYLGSDGKPNAFVISMGKTLIQVAYYHVGADAEHLARLTALAAKLPSIPFDLTAKNAALLRQLESPKLRAKLLFLPEALIAEVREALAMGRLLFVLAQVAMAVDIALVIPLRPQNLCSLVWRRHFSEPDGPKGRLLLHIPAAETKSKKKDVVAEIPEEVANRIRWYRQHMLPRLPDPNGPLFVTERGDAKPQETLSDQIIKVIRNRLGVHMPPHTFRHLAATLYLEEHPEDFETVRALLGHAFGKTTMVYAGNSHRRGAAAYGKVLQEKRQALKLNRPRKPTSKKKPT